MLNPPCTVPTVIVTLPGADPTVTGAPFNVSLAVNGAVVPPVFPLIDGVVSVTASISGAVTVTLVVTVSQLLGLVTSQIV